ncbi:MAG: hypothetical protein ABI851_07165 [Saprospiraceae bacterium]
MYPSKLNQAILFRTYTLLLTFLAVLSIPNSAKPISHTSISLNFQLQNSIEELLNQVSLSIEKQSQLLVSRDKQINELREELAYADLDKHKKKILFEQLNSNLSLKQNLEDKKNCFLFVLTQLHQLQYISNKNRLKKIENIKQLITKIETGKIKYLELETKYAFNDFKESAYNYLPNIDCNLEKSTDGKILANQFSPLFNYTPLDIEKHYSDLDFLNTYVKLLHTNKHYFIEFKFEFNSLKILEVYGILDKNSPMKLIFMDDAFIYLDNAITSPPDVQNKTGKTVIRMQASLSKSDLKKITNKDLDRLIILWPSGAESYEIFNFHCLQSLLKCIQLKN